MAGPPSIRFADCELDLAAYVVRRAGQPCAVEPQVFELLAFLASNPERLITKDELIEKVWGGRIVSDSALSSRIKSARQAIGDDGKQQRLIKTVHGRGVRFVGDVAPRAEHATALQPPSTPGRAAPIGRESQLARLREHLRLAQDGRRQIVFVTGEPGLGKTTLIDSFMAELQAGDALRVGAGQCLEHRGISEAYMPVLEAIGRLCRTDSAGLIQQLAARAPSWLVQMPWLVTAPELEALQRRAQGITRERMLREMVEAIEAITAERPLILVLEDLHWSDPSTVDLIVRLAQRREPARFLLIGTFRPSDLATAQHALLPVLSELRAHGQCAELALPLLDEKAVAACLAARFGAGALPASLTRVLFQRTEGNPLFVKNVIDSWIDRRQLVQQDGGWVLAAAPHALAVGAPESLRQLIEQQLARLDPAAQAMLEIASVVGREFSTSVVAAVAGRTEEEVETTAAMLAQRSQFLHEHADAAWKEDADEAVGARFGFLHDLYRDVLYARIANSRRRQIHRRIGEALEAEYGIKAAEHAAELGLHFLRGRDPERAIAYAQQAADLALRRGAHREAFTHLASGLAALSRIEDIQRRGALEAGLQIARAAAFIAHEGYGADSTEQAYLRAYDLTESQPDRTLRFKALYGLFVFRWNRGRMREAATLADEMLTTADSTGDAAVQSVANRALAVVDNAHGAFARAHLHAQRAAALYDPQSHAASARFYIQDIGVGAFIHGALAAWHLGRDHEAFAAAEKALRLARRTEHANTICYATFFVAYLHILARRAETARALAAELVQFADERYIRYWAASGRGVLGAAHVIGGDLRQGRTMLIDALERMHAIRLETFQPTFWTFLAEAEATLGAVDAARRHLDEALSRMAASQEVWFEPEALRLRGRLLQQTGAPPEAVRHDLEAAHQAAASQESRWYQLRATLDLARLLASQDKRRRARDFLATCLKVFHSESQGPELAEAKALRDSLARSDARPAGSSDRGATAADASTVPRGLTASALQQEIHFCTAQDGVRIAYASVGQGPPLVRPANWMTHLEFDWQSPVWRHWIRELARDHRLIRYDERANGLSDWSVKDLSFDAMVRDLEAVIEANALERFPLFCLSQGCAIALAYAARHPERVSRLVLYGGYARGWAMRGSAEDIARRHALSTLIEHGWGQDNPAFRQVFTTLFIPDASAEQVRWFNELQRRTASPANALRLHHAFGEIDVRPLLAHVKVPTLVLNARDDGVVPFEEGRLLATGIPGARFVPLDSRNHILLETEPAWPVFLDEVRAFLAADA